MKSLKIALAAMFLTVGAITLSSFVADNYDAAAFARKCIKYKGTLPATSSTVVIAGNWELAASTTESVLNGLCPNRNQLCVICFEESVDFTQADAQAILATYLSTHSQSLSGLANDPDVIVDPNDNTKSIQVFQILPQ